jgi:hypothetical protein
VRRRGASFRALRDGDSQAGPLAQYLGDDLLRRARAGVELDGGFVAEQLVDALSLRERGRTVGGSEVMCVFVTRNIGRCHGTLRLGRGMLEACGGVHFGGTFSLPVVGGTGTHAGAAGVLRVTAVDDRRSSYQIDLQS